VRYGQQEPKKAPEPAEPIAPTASPRSDAKKILIVDDDPDVLEVLSRFLQKAPLDYTVQAVGNGEDAIAALVLEPPDLVLLDLNMPGVNGLEVLKHIGREIPVMIVSGNVDATPAEALKYGAFAYLPKPFDLTYIEQLVPLALTRRRAPKAWVSQSGV
jgi:DNA-binding NtrC family response regulator